MLLENKVAVIYGGGAISGAVADAFAREGATIFLAGRNQKKLDTVANDLRALRAKGQTIETAILDVFDEPAVNQYVDDLVKKAGKVDISFNLIGVGDVQKPLMDISLEHFLRPVMNTLKGHFLTTKAAARHMVKQGSGVVLAFGGDGTQTPPGLGGFKISLDALESLRRQWSVELGKQGIRVVTLKTGGILETISDNGGFKAEMKEAFERQALLSYTAALADVGNVAAFVASDLARTLTATEVNISCGAIID